MGNIILTTFISHGAPTSLVERTRIHDIYERLGKLLTERCVDTIIVSSPHYLSHGKFEVDLRESIPCLQDYYGFPEELYKFSYDAKDNLELAAEIVRAAEERRLPVSGSTTWGLDHGAWLPLHFMFPERGVKVVPVSITDGTPEQHFEFGKVIRAAAGKMDGTFAFMSTGSPVHRLDLMRYGYYGEEKFEPGSEFNRRLIEIVEMRDFGRILKIQEEYPSLFRAAAPEGGLRPLFTALGASDELNFVGKNLVDEFMYYAVSLVAFVLGATPELRAQILKLGAPNQTVG